MTVTYEVVYDPKYGRWGILVNNSLEEEFATKRQAIDQARSNAKRMAARPEGKSVLIIENKHGEQIKTSEYS